MDSEKKFEFSEELIEMFKRSQFSSEEAKLINLNSGKEIDIKPDEDGWIYIPELTYLHPTSLTNNGDDENAGSDYSFVMKLINEFREQVLRKDE